MLFHTVDTTLVVLTARLAAQGANAGFLIDLDGDRGLAVAEDAFEGGRKRVALR